MQHDIINIAGEMQGFEMIDSTLSFRGFLNYLRDMRSHEKTMNVRFLESVISSFGRRLPENGEITLEEVSQYEDLMQWIYALLFPPIDDGRKNIWVLTLPMKPVIFFGTDAFYNRLKNSQTGEIEVSLIDKDNKGNRKINLELVYSFILRRLYNYEYAPGNKMIHSWYDPVTGIPKHYRLDIDTRFVEILPKKGFFPPLTPEMKSHLHEASSIGYLREALPLSLFRFVGISAINFVDVTGEYAIESIKNTILSTAACETDDCGDQVIGSLKALAGNTAVNFSLLPFLKVNGKVVFSGENWFHSILTGALREYDDAESTYLSMTTKYFANPRLILFESLSESDEKSYSFLKILRKSGVYSYALLPVYYNNHLAGALEVYCGTPGILNHEMLSRLDLAVPLLAQLLQKSIDELDAEIKAVVKENYTAVQPSVEWKFYETAWHYLRDHFWKGDHSGLEPIRFKNVYPLYGALDIRNSTIERNKALKSDLETQFGFLSDTLSALEKEFADSGSGVDHPLVEALITKCAQWLNRFSGTLTTAGEMELNEFLITEIGSFLDHARESLPGCVPIIDLYREATDESTGFAYSNRRDLENSIQLINTAINEQLETSVGELQKDYPFYFEKFRTDGVEYDIYIGKSITPEKPFDGDCLRDLRLWQLRSMAALAVVTHDLIPEMKDPLYTTQLIFVHSAPIDISFRQDERRFDVEGSYNIRYEVVKKRIDKVRLSGRDERLTQPGKIAIVYFNDREGEEYIGYIKRLQQEGILEDDLEIMELEELQGVTGLKACRVGVKFKGYDENR